MLSALWLADTPYFRTRSGSLALLGPCRRTCRHGRAASRRVSVSLELRSGRPAVPPISETRNVPFRTPAVRTASPVWSCGTHRLFGSNLLSTRRRPNMPHADLRFPKGPTATMRYEGKRKHRADIIRAVRLQVMQRDTSCRSCGSTNGAEMHELTPRSLLRGQPPEDIYTLGNCLRLCSKCHGQVTRHELTLVAVTPARGADGRIETQPTFRSRHVQTPSRPGRADLEG